MKPIVFHPAALAFIRGEDQELRKAIGEALRDLQKGISLGMPLSRPMPVVASGVHELRVRSKTTAVRVFYFMKLAEAIRCFTHFGKRHSKPLNENWPLGVND